MVPQKVPTKLLKELQEMAGNTKRFFDLENVVVDKNALVATDSIILGKADLSEDISLSEEPSDPRTIRGYKFKISQLDSVDEAVIKETIHGLNLRWGSWNTCYNTSFGKYPDYKEVIPEKSSGVKVTYNIEALRKLLDFMESAGYKEVEMRIPGNACPTRVDGHEDSKKTDREFDDIESALGLIAPYLEEEDTPATFKSEDNYDSR